MERKERRDIRARTSENKKESLHVIKKCTAATPLRGGPTVTPALVVRALFSPGLLSFIAANRTGAASSKRNPH